PAPPGRARRAGGGACRGGRTVLGVHALPV
ncbi:MAG: hypothetical protein AVDCRST_MAG20-199, partial [uncultured Acidimicrobiales bacterium]